MLNSDFRPNWVSSPGDTVIDILNERSISLPDFANDIGLPIEAVNDLIQGRTVITLNFARKLQKTLGASVEFWLNRDYQYRKDIARFKESEDEWINQLPVEDMIKFRWISPVNSETEKIIQYLNYFNVPSIEAWYQKYEGIMQKVAFKRTYAYESKPASVATWLRQGEIISEGIECKDWDPVSFRLSLLTIRQLTKEKDPKIFIPKLVHYCSDSGVALVIVPTPKGCPVSGATRFINPQKALMLLSFRYRTDDHFWFTFFHEAGHLLLHGNKELFLESDDYPFLLEEEEANEFAENLLIPVKYKQELLQMKPEFLEILRFARKVNISPGIIVGQLQHYGIIPSKYFYKLKNYYSWNE